MATENTRILQMRGVYKALKRLHFKATASAHLANDTIAYSPLASSKPAPKAKVVAQKWTQTLVLRTVSLWTFLNASRASLWVVSAFPALVANGESCPSRPPATKGEEYGVLPTSEGLAVATSFAAFPLFSRPPFPEDVQNRARYSASLNSMSSEALSLA